MYLQYHTSMYWDDVSYDYKCTYVYIYIKMCIYKRICITFSLFYIICLSKLCSHKTYLTCRHIFTKNQLISPPARLPCLQMSLMISPQQWRCRIPNVPNLPYYPPEVQQFAPEKWWERKLSLSYWVLVTFSLNVSHLQPPFVATNFHRRFVRPKICRWSMAKANSPALHWMPRELNQEYTWVFWSHKMLISLNCEIRKWTHNTNIYEEFTWKIQRCDVFIL